MPLLRLHTAVDQPIVFGCKIEKNGVMDATTYSVSRDQQDLYPHSASVLPTLRTDPAHLF